MISAELAWQYDRTLMALPGKAGEEKSAGCNFLIKTNRAELIESASDLLRSLSWDTNQKTRVKQPELPLDLSQEAVKLLNILKDNKAMAIDDLTVATGLSASLIALALLDLELKALIRTLPGKRYQYISF